ncbi:MAG: hypothetical protein OEW15_02195 [Nitrospirota bacterium]|nr:hypothetical protein [Nitrospirota bacterium]
MRTGITWMIAALLGLVGCSSTFLASKDGKGYHIGSGSDAAFEMFCKSGDMARILNDTKLPQETRDRLFRATCAEERSGTKVKELYGTMSPEQRKDLRQAFRRNGYDINYLPC